MGTKIRDLSNTLTASGVVNPANIRFGVDDVSDNLSKQFSLAELKKAGDIRVVSNVAAMQGLTDVKDNQLIQTLGYSSEGVGSNLYRYDASSSATHDGGFIITATGAGVGRFIAVDQTVADVTKFGGSNASDSSAAFAAALAASDKVVLSTDLVIASPIVVGGGKYIDLQRNTITQTSNNTPIFTVDQNALNSRWLIANGRIEHATQQGAGDTDGVAIRLGGLNKMAHLGVIENLNIARSYKAIEVPNLTGCFAFLILLRNIYITQCWDFAIDWQGSSTGAHTNVVLSNVWAQNSDLNSTMKGFRFYRINGLNIQNAGCDGLKNTPICAIFSSRANIDVLWSELLSLNYSSGTQFGFQFSNSVVNAELIYTYGHSVTITGDANFHAIRADTSSDLFVKRYQESTTTISDTSSGYYYQALPDSTSQIHNESFASDYTAPHPFGFGEVAYRVRKWNGSVRQETKGEKTHTYRTAYPTSGTWGVGDVCVNTTPLAGGITSWVCTTAGTPGTWQINEVSSGTGTFADGDTTPSVATLVRAATTNTAPTTLYGLDDAIIGQEYTIILGGNDTVAHNTATDSPDFPFILDGAANLTPGSGGGILKVLIHDGFAKEVSYTSF